ncbi:hypothetical protein SPRG_08833 [Saprolegnia parasitica CBS 223.65]|uniref:Uncharacterized protein n=1 Tax=Saprolegnia parasitica (strain CBS 223.65) TaxID=695850 RepID=A0A067CH69_SAPPC|nr:hypothetical protein SPRG_08833 [Saprolegnia parasitica CBS 223.65]KDO25891.1 hypothetical protein SPRG_08833 [Saprolegnia parasitica CBS 223.65]|eukprot:XP_012203452.1 hypothetical protein SPRG_08833 [Saprolegnia parasitica CBS 223.65]
MSLTDLRRELEKVGVSSSTPGLRGEDRRGALYERWLGLQCSNQKEIRLASSAAPLDATGDDVLDPSRSPMKQSQEKRAMAQALYNDVQTLRQARVEAVARRMGDDLASLDALRRELDAIPAGNVPSEDVQTLQSRIAALERKEAQVRGHEQNDDVHGVRAEAEKVGTIAQLESEIRAHHCQGFKELVAMDGPRMNPLLAPPTSLNHLRRQTLGSTIARGGSERTLPVVAGRDRIQTFSAPPPSAPVSKAEKLGRKAFFLHRIKGDYDLAEQTFNEAIELEPTNSQNLGHYALFLDHVRGRLDDAEEYYLRAIDAPATDATQLSNYASFLQRMRNDTFRAEEYYKRGLSAFPRDASHMGNYASFLRLVKGDKDKARVYLTKALAVQPDHINNLVQFASLLTEIGHLKDAGDVYERALVLDVENANLYGNYANMLRKANQLSRAKDLYLKAMRMDPSNAIVAQNYALLLRDHPSVRTGETRRIQGHPADHLKRVANDVHLLSKAIRAFPSAK